MKDATRWLLRWHGLPLVAVLALVSLPVVLVSRGTNDGMPVGTVVLLVVVAVLTLILIARVALMLAGVDPDAATIAQGLTAAPDQQRLLTRWLRRTRWARNVGGLAGLTWWVFGTSLQGDVLLFGVGGIAVGSMAAQIHHIRQPSGARTASLEARSVATYIPHGTRRRLIAVAALAAAMVLAAALPSEAGTALAWGLAALGVIAMTYLVQRRVAGRPRPALTTGLQHADDLARELAIDRGLAQPAMYFALALVAHGASNLEPSIGGFAVLASIGAWLYALVAWWQNRRLGLDGVMKRAHTIPAIG